MASRSFVRFAAVALCAMVLGGCVSTPTQAPAEKRTYSFWPPAPDEPRIQFLVSYNRSTDVSPPRSSLDETIFGSQAAEAYPINKPYGVRFWNGRIYVCDVRGTGIVVLDLPKQQARLMGATGSSAIRKAVDLAIAPDGTKYVVDSAQSQISVFSPEERYVKSLRLTDTNPVAIALYQDRLYVSDLKNAHVKVLDRETGELLHTIGERGGEDGQFIGPLGVAVDRQGNIYVSDFIKARVQKFAPDGTFLLGFGQTGNRPGQFVRPKHLAIGSDDHIHVVDAAFNNVQVFDSEGRVVGFYGGLGSFPGAMDLPAGLEISEKNLEIFARYIHPAFQAERLIFVANQFGDQKVSVYAMGRLKPGYTVADTSADSANTSGSITISDAPRASDSTAGPTTRPAN